jgi:competence protein ComEC
MRKPLVLITLAYIAGILFGLGFLYFPCSVSAGIFITAAVLLALVLFRRLSLRVAAIIAVAAVMGMAGFLLSAAWFPPDHVARTAGPDSSVHDITGRIVSPLDRDPDRTSAVIQLNSLDEKPVSGRARLSLRSGEAPFGYGDVLRSSGRVFRPRAYANPGGFDYPAYLAQNGIHCTVTVKDPAGITLLARGSGLFRFIQDLRERMRRSFLAGVHGPGSAILQAMVLGEEGGLTDELRDRFMTAGVTHIISISGSHLGMLALLCFGFIRGALFLLPDYWYNRLTLLADPKKIAAGLTLPLIVFYSLVAGGQTATIRSLIMLSAGLIALVLDRDHSIPYALAVAALVSLIADPQALFDISFQFSYLSVFVIAAVVSFHRDARFPAVTALQKLANNTVLLIVLSLAVTLATGPLSAFYFNRISLMGVVSNLVVVPFAGIVIVPLGLFSAILSLFAGALPFAGLNQAAADAFIGLVEIFARMPGAEVHTRAPGVIWLLLYASLIICAFIALRTILLARRRPLEYPGRVPRMLKPALLLSAACLLIISFAPIRRSDATRLTFVDVGQGDCTLVTLASGGTILIDGGGTHDNRFDIGRRVVAPFLWGQGVRRLDIVILSHPHPDHMNGLLFELAAFDIGQVWTHGFDRDLPGYDAFRRIIARRNITQRTVSAATPDVRIGTAVISVLHPAEGFIATDGKAYAAENNRSLVVRIADENGAYLFTGDIGAPVEELLLQNRAAVKCNVLKVPHHGSKSSSSSAFLAAAGPAVAVVCVGDRNLYGHPAAEVLERYSRAGARIYRTDLDGALMISARKNRLTAAGWRGLLLSRIDPRNPAAWWEREKENMQRVWIRTGVI